MKEGINAEHVHVEERSHNAPPPNPNPNLLNYDMAYFEVDVMCRYNLHFHTITASICVYSTLMNLKSLSVIFFARLAGSSTGIVPVLTGAGIEGECSNRPFS